MWHAWLPLEAAYAIAFEFLGRFVSRGAGHWREAPLDNQHPLVNLPRVCTELDALDAVSDDPDALTDAIEAAIKASVQALHDPHRSAALKLLGFTIDSRGKGKTERETRASDCLRRSGRWLRTPSREYGGLEPRVWLLSSVAAHLAADPARATAFVVPSAAQLAGSAPRIDRQFASSLARPASADDRRTGDPAVPDNAKVWPSFPYERVCHQMASARTHIRILQTWLPDTQPLATGIAEAVRNGASIEILIQHPHAPTVADRLTALGISDPDYAYYHAVKLFADLRNVISIGKPGQIVVRTCLMPPSGQLYATDEILWFGFFWPDRYSLQGPQVEVSTHHSHLGRTLWDYFETLWSSASPLVATDLQRIT